MTYLRDGNGEIGLCSFLRLPNLTQLFLLFSVDAVVQSDACSANVEPGGPNNNVERTFDTVGRQKPMWSDGGNGSGGEGDVGKV